MTGEPVKVDTSTFQSAMNQFIALKRISLRAGIRMQAGLLADDLVKDTPPTKGEVSGKNYGPRKAGEARIARDVTRAARALDPKKWREKGIAELIRAKKYETLQTVFERFSSDRIIQFLDGQPHQKARDESGRVRKSKSQATPDFLEHAAYTRKMKKRVGIAKGGWVAAQRALGRKVQAWLAPHAWAGSFTDQTDAVEPRVKMFNDSNWAGGRMADVIVGRAMARREGRMERWIAGALAANARKAGLS